MDGTKVCINYRHGLTSARRKTVWSISARIILMLLLRSGRGYENRFEIGRKVKCKEEGTAGIMY